MTFQRDAMLAWETGMPNHCENRRYVGKGRRSPLDRMIVTGASCLALDTGDADDFTFAAAGSLACSRGVRPQGEIAGA